MELNCRPNIIVNVVYKTKEGFWRGFCSPFDVTCEANTQKKAITQLEESVKLYLDGLKKYNFPKHLSIKPLSSPKDKKIFDEVIVEIMEHKYEEYQQSERVNYKREGIFSSLYQLSNLYQPCFA